MLGDVEGQRGLAHRRTRGEDDQVAGLQARGQSVEVIEAGADAGHFLGAVLVQLVDAVDQLHDQLVHALEALPRLRAFFADAKDLAFGLVEYLRDRTALRIEGTGRDLVAGRHQFAQHRALAHDLGVAADVGCARHALRQRVQVGEAAALFGLAQALQLLEDGDHVGRLGRVDQYRHGREYQSVLEAIEVRLGQQVADPIPRAVVEQQAAEHALLGLDRVRRHAQSRDLVVGSRLGGKLGGGKQCRHRQIISPRSACAGGQTWGRRR